MSRLLCALYKMRREKDDKVEKIKGGSSDEQQELETYLCYLSQQMKEAKNMLEAHEQQRQKSSELAKRPQQRMIQMQEKQLAENEAMHEETKQRLDILKGASGHLSDTLNHEFKKQLKSMLNVLHTRHQLLIHSSHETLDKSVGAAGEELEDDAD